MSPNTDIGIKLFNFAECNNLSQLVDEPTRITALGESILDLIITDAPGYFVSSGTLSPPANCDHNFIFAKLSISSHISQKLSKGLFVISKMLISLN